MLNRIEFSLENIAEYISVYPNISHQVRKADEMMSKYDTDKACIFLHVPSEGNDYMAAELVKKEGSYELNPLVHVHAITNWPGLSGQRDTFESLCEFLDKGDFDSWYYDSVRSGDKEPFEILELPDSDSRCYFNCYITSTDENLLSYPRQLAHTSTGEDTKGDGYFLEIAVVRRPFWMEKVPDPVAIHKDYDTYVMSYVGHANLDDAVVAVMLDNNLSGEEALKRVNFYKDRFPETRFRFVQAINVIGNTYQ